MAELYQLTFADGRRYIGISKTTAAARFARHRRNARSTLKKFGSAKYRAWRSLGEPTMAVLASGSLADIVAMERSLIDANTDGYNSAKGGGGVKACASSAQGL
jgi:hypothetical protein